MSQEAQARSWERASGASPCALYNPKQRDCQKQQYHTTNSRRSVLFLSDGCLAYEKTKNKMGIRVFIIPHGQKNVKLRFSLQKNPHLMTNFQQFFASKNVICSWRILGNGVSYRKEVFSKKWHFLQGKSRLFVKCKFNEKLEIASQRFSSSLLSNSGREYPWIKYNKAVRFCQYYLIQDITQRLNINIVFSPISKIF